MKFFNIEFKGYLKDIDALPKNDLAKKYNRLENSNDINEIMKQIYIYAIPLEFYLCISLLLLHNYSRA